MMLKRCSSPASRQTGAQCAEDLAESPLRLVSKQTDSGSRKVRSPYVPGFPARYCVEWSPGLKVFDPFFWLDSAES